MIIEEHIKLKYLEKGWCDNDIVMLHACFQLLEDCVEQEDIFNVIVWDNSSDLLEVKHKIKKLYDWWKSRLTADNFVSSDQYDEDSNKLIELIKLRGYLWT